MPATEGEPSLRASPRNPSGPSPTTERVRPLLPSPPHRHPPTAPLHIENQPIPAYKWLKRGNAAAFAAQAANSAGLTANAGVDFVFTPLRAGEARAETSSAQGGMFFVRAPCAIAPWHLASTTECLQKNPKPRCSGPDAAPSTDSVSPRRPKTGRSAHKRQPFRNGGYTLWKQ